MQVPRDGAGNIKTVGGAAVYAANSRRWRTPRSPPGGRAPRSRQPWWHRWIPRRPQRRGPGPRAWQCRRSRRADPVRPGSARSGRPRPAPRWSPVPRLSRATRLRSVFTAAMVALGTTLSAFWIMINNSWMQVPVGYVGAERNICSRRLAEDHLQPGRHGGALCTCCWRPTSPAPSASPRPALGTALRNIYRAEARVMLRMGLFLAAVLLPMATPVRASGLATTYTSYQPAKFAAIEARWNDEQPAAEVIIAIPDEATQSNRYELKIPGSGQHHREHEYDLKGGWARSPSHRQTGRRC